MIRVRFAPAPIGHLLVSGARLALANYLFARRNGGEMLLRLDDLDAERCRPAHAEAIARDLHWFGIGWQHSYPSVRAAGTVPRRDRAAEARRLPVSLLRIRRGAEGKAGVPAQARPAADL